jgi:hypothetical protein
LDELTAAHPNRSENKNMSRHLYNVGEAVTLTPHSGHYLKTSGAYVVSAQMPPLGDVLQYRIKCASEPYERVVAEHQLNRADADSLPPADAVVALPKTALKTWAGRGIRAASAVPPRDRAVSRPR